MVGRKNLLRDRKVIVHLSGDAPSIEGVLLRHANGHYFLLEATTKALKGEGIEGTTAIPEHRVIMLQLV